MKTKQYESMIRTHTPYGYPNLVCGWPDTEHGIDWEFYKDDCLSLVDAMQEGDDAPSFQSFKEWCVTERNKAPNRDNLGFSNRHCELCDALPGERYAVTAYDRSMDEYRALAVCGDCLDYIVNGEVPDYVGD